MSKRRIISLLKSIKREGMDDLIDYMERSGFFTAPCSTQFHLAQQGGLAQHSLNVYDKAHELALAWKVPLKDVRIDSVVICSLLHDLGKCGQFGKQEYVPNILKDGTQSKAKPWERNKELLNVDHEVRSVAIISQYIELYEEEQFAILYHNGLYGNFKYNIQGNETPLYMLIHFADMWCSRVVEV